MTTPVLIASDHAGFDLKERLKEGLTALGYEPVDLGTYSGDSVDYPDYANKLAEELKKPDYDFGVLVCGSGIGIDMAANRHQHVRCALCCDAVMAGMARAHNNANVIALGARLIEADVAKEALKVFLETPFEGGRHQGRIDKFSC